MDTSWSLFGIKVCSKSTRKLSLDNPRYVDNIDNNGQTEGPFGFAPSAAHKLAHADGEIATSRAAAANGIPMALSSYATTSLEDVSAQGLGNPYMMQMTFFKDLSVCEMIIKRAEGMPAT